MFAPGILVEGGKVMCPWPEAPTSVAANTDDRMLIVADQNKKKLDIT